MEQDQKKYGLELGNLRCLKMLRSSTDIESPEYERYTTLIEEKKKYIKKLKDKLCQS